MRTWTMALMMLGLGCGDGLAPRGERGLEGVLAPLALMDLQAGDSLRVRFAWFGCFQRTRGDLVFAALENGRLVASGTARYDVFGAESADGRGREATAAMPIPMHVLTLNERYDLDRGFAYHREGADHMCSNSTVFALTLVRDGAPVRTETIESHRCGYNEGQVAPAYSFHDLLASAGDPRSRWKGAR